MIDVEEQDQPGKEHDPDPDLEMACISLADGKSKWREKNSSMYAAGTPLANGFEIVENHRTGGMAMVHLPERRTVWTLEKYTGPVFAHKPDHEDASSQAPLIYTNTMMIRGLDGTVGFEYPTTFTPPAVTDRWLILKKDGSEHENSRDEKPSELLILDRFSGKELTILRPNPFDSFFYISEDDSFVYLGTYKLPVWFFLAKASSSLLLIDKRNPALRELSLGEGVAVGGGWCQTCSGRKKKETTNITNSNYEFIILATTY